MKLKLYTHVEEPVPVVVIIPYTKPSTTLQTVIDCLRVQQVQPVLWKVGGGDEYWNLLNLQWSMGGTFFIVEQDVVVWHGAIQQLAHCEERWCTLSTLCHGRMIPTTFGCVKFSADLIERNPGFWADIPTTWFHLDAHFSDKMGWPFIRPHSHLPPATHLNEIQWPDEVSLRYSLERKMVWQSMEAGGPVVKVESSTGHVTAAVVEVDKMVGYDSPET